MSFINVDLESFAGLAYLSFWLCSKFSIAFPYLAVDPPSHYSQRDEGQAIAPESNSSDSEHRHLHARNEGAAPPVYMFILAAVPNAIAILISASRWFDHRHHGFDCVAGCVIGIFFAWIGSRLYHLPIQRGAGWSWGPRSHKHAFFRGIGHPNHFGDNNWASDRAESGRLALD